MQSNINEQIRKIIDEAFLLVLRSAEETYYPNTGDDLVKKEEAKGNFVQLEILKEISRISDFVVPDQVEEFEVSTSPLLKYTDSALVNGTDKTELLLELLKPVMTYLPWKYNYEEREDKPNLGARIGWAELIGPEAPYRTSEYCLGFTLIAPDTIYPEHSHPATELYHVLSGDAYWTLDGNKRKRIPGELILHPSLHKHQMETEEETLLALYLWTGSDVVTLSEYSD